MLLNLPETKEKYFVFVNIEELYENLKVLGFDNVVFVNKGLLSAGEYQELIDAGKGVMFVWYVQYEEYYGIEDFPILSQVAKHLPKVVNSSYAVGAITPYFYSNDGMSKEEFVRCMTDDYKHICDLADDRRWIEHSDYEGKCGNCHTKLPEEAKYCPVCGTKRGEGEFNPYYNDVDCVYGPPGLFTWHCKWCDITREFPSFEGVRFCEKCGKQMKISKCHPMEFEEWFKYLDDLSVTNEDDSIEENLA